MNNSERIWLVELLDEYRESGDSYSLGYLEGVIDGLNKRKTKSQYDISVKNDDSLCEGDELLYISTKGKA